MGYLLRGILLAALLGIAGLTGAGAAASDARVEAFRTICIPDRQDYEAILVRASADGWKVVTGEANTELKAVLDASADPGAGASNAIRSFSKEIEGKTTFLVTSRVTSGQYV